MARALIVGCGCRGRELGRALIERGWLVRGTSRSEEGLGPIGDAGIEPALADPDRVATICDQLDGVALVFWLLGSATGPDEQVAALHGPRLRRMLEEIVDTPVRGFVYELSGGVAPEHAVRAVEALRDAGRTWRIPFEVVDADGERIEEWREAMLAAATELTGA